MILHLNPNGLAVRLLCRRSSQVPDLVVVLRQHSTAEPVSKFRLRIIAMPAAFHLLVSGRTGFGLHELRESMMWFGPDRPGTVWS